MTGNKHDPYPGFPFQCPGGGGGGVGGLELSRVSTPLLLSIQICKAWQYSSSAFISSSLFVVIFFIFKNIIYFRFDTMFIKTGC